MRIHHHRLAAAVGLPFALLLPRSVDAVAAAVARLSAVEQTPRPGRLLQSSPSGRQDDDTMSSHHGPVELVLPGDVAELIHAKTIELSFPTLGSADHEVHTYGLDWRDEAGGGWHGKDFGGSTAHFVASPLKDDLFDQENRLAGVVHRGDGTVLRITTKPDGSHWFESWLEDNDEKARPGNDQDGAQTRRILQEVEFGDDDGSQIDHLSVYTRRAMCEHALVGYYPCPPTPYVRAPIEEFIALQYTMVNFVLLNTGVPTRLNSVHVFMEEDYDQNVVGVEEVEADPTKSEIGVALNDLKNHGSGHLEEARRRQDVYCADIVTLFGTIGLGLASGPYNVVNHGSGGWGFAHEIGHSIYAGHRDDSLDKEGYKYGYGNDEYATIMAFGGKKVPMYSTPDYTWDGKVVGTAKEDNRRSIMDNLLVTTNRRRSEMCKPSCEFGADGSPLGCPADCSKCHFPANFCYDDPFFRYEGDLEEDCEWVRKNRGKCDDVVVIDDGKKIRVEDHCQDSCDACPATITEQDNYPPNPEGACEDDPAFLRNSDSGKDCDWVSSDIAGRCPKTAGTGYNDTDRVYDHCRLSCGLCHLINPPTPSPTACEDVPGLHFQSGVRGCDWIAEKLDVRCENFSMTETLCKQTCGHCDAPTPSPTPRGPCTDDEDWVYQAPEDKYDFLTCAWVREDTLDRCLHSKMKHHCPVTCGTCCEDEDEWHYGKNQAWEGNPEKTCAWYGTNGCNNAANSHCPRTCGLCPDHLANAGGPHYDIDYRKVRGLRG